MGDAVVEIVSGVPSVEVPVALVAKMFVGDVTVADTVEAAVVAMEVAREVAVMIA